MPIPAWLMPTSLWGNLLLVYAIVFLVNVPAPLLGLRFNDGPNGQRLWYEPPGFVIPLVWTVLFTLFALARYELRLTSQANGSWLVFWLVVVCASYAYYTLGLERLTQVSALWWGLWGNLVVIAFAGYVVWVLWPLSVKAALLVLPTILWTLFATALVLGQLRQKGLL